MFWFVFSSDCGGLLEKPWRNMQWNSEWVKQTKFTHFCNNTDVTLVCFHLFFKTWLNWLNIFLEMLWQFDNDTVYRRRKVLLSTISGWKPSVSSVKQARILLVGPVGAGKSSFFNSINSVFKGYVSSQANTGTAGTSLTTRVYMIFTPLMFFVVKYCAKY